MLIINADDWGGWPRATDAAFRCFQSGRITSVSAMVFMEDSLRAAELAKDSDLDVGLHLNLNESLTGRNVPERLAESHARLKRFLRSNRYSQVVYLPWLRRQFQEVCRAQVEEFIRIYGHEPSHVDGHQHLHLCLNMLLDGIIEAGRAVRRSFSFWPGEKGPINRMYRRWIDQRLTRRHVVTDFFFSLAQCLSANSLPRVATLASNKAVELMAHPEHANEYDWLMSEACLQFLQGIELGTYSLLNRNSSGRPQCAVIA